MSSEANSGRRRRDSSWFKWLTREIAKVLDPDDPTEAIETLYYLGGDGLLRYIKATARKLAGKRLQHADCEDVLMELYLKK